MCYPRFAATTMTMLAASIAVSSCGGDDEAANPDRPPARTVAEVGSAAIAEDALDHWTGVFARSQPSGDGGPIVPDPPRFARCVRRLARELSAAGARQRTDRQLERICRRNHRQVVRQALSFLIQVEWIEREAARRGVAIDEDALRERFERELADTFPEEGDLERYLRRTALTRDDLMLQLRFTELQARLMGGIKDRIEITDAEVARHYRRNRDGYDAPLAEVRESIRSKLKSDRELDELSGFTDSVAKRYSSITECRPGYSAPECGGDKLQSDAR